MTKEEFEKIINQYKLKYFYINGDYYAVRAITDNKVILCNNYLGVVIKIKIRKIHSIEIESSYGNISQDGIINYESKIELYGVIYIERSQYT